MPAGFQGSCGYRSSSIMLKIDGRAGWPAAPMGGRELTGHCVRYGDEYATPCGGASCCSRNVYWLWPSVESCRHRLSWCPTTSVVSPACMPRMAAAVEAVEVTVAVAALEVVATAVMEVVTVEAVTVLAVMEPRVAIMALPAMTVTVMEVRGAATLTMVV
ncbi:hypothetical protein EMIT0P258_120165 [Pseudomonas sp. IT-P258]